MEFFEGGRRFLFFVFCFRFNFFAKEGFKKKKIYTYIYIFFAICSLVSGYFYLNFFWGGSFTIYSFLFFG